MAVSNFFDYVIVGGGIAGTTAAETIRLHDHSGSILIISGESEVLYSRVLLPKYLQGKLAREKMYLRALDNYTKNGIDVALGQEVVGVNFDTRELITSEEKKISFRKMLVASGGRPNAWNVPGGESTRVLRFQTLHDTDIARACMTEHRGSSISEAVVVGGGFIGLEFMDAALAHGYKTHLFLQKKNLFSGLYDEAGAKIFESTLEQNNIVLHPDTVVARLEESSDGLTVYGSHETVIKNAAWCGVGIGLKKNLVVFEGSGIEIGRGVRTNSFLETSLKDVWAAGDIAEYHDAIFNERRIVGTWTNSFMQGKVAGANMAGVRTEFKTVSTYSAKNLGLHITHVGMVENLERGEYIVRVWPGGTAYERLFMRDGILVGAVLINRFQDKVALSALIEVGARIAPYADKISDIHFDVSVLVQEFKK